MNPETHAAKNLFVDALACELVVSVHEAGPVSLRFEMPAVRAAKISRRIVSDALMICDRHEAASATTIVTRGSGGHHQVVIAHSTIGSIAVAAGSRVIIDGREVLGSARNPEPPAKLHVSVPRGANVALRDPFADATLADIDGDLEVSGDACGRVRCGRVRSVALSMAGNADVDVAEVCWGNIDVQMQGTGDVEIAAGRADRCTVAIQGTGSFSFGGVAESASLAVQGTGSIRVKHVLGSVRERIQGTGRIRVGKRG